MTERQMKTCRKFAAHFIGGSVVLLFFGNVLNSALAGSEPSFLDLLETQAENALCDQESEYRACLSISPDECRSNIHQFHHTCQSEVLSKHPDFDPDDLTISEEKLEEVRSIAITYGNCVMRLDRETHEFSEATIECLEGRHTTD